MIKLPNMQDEPKDAYLNDTEELLGHIKEEGQQINPNKMNEDRFREIIEHLDDEQAQVAIQILSRKYWAYMFDILKIRFGRMAHYYSTIRDLSESQEFKL